MSILSPHIAEVGKTLSPLYGPETPTEAVNRLLGFYQRLPEGERFAFVATLIGELVMERIQARQKVLRRPVKELGGAP